MSVNVSGNHISDTTFFTVTRFPAPDTVYSISSKGYDLQMKMIKKTAAVIAAVSLSLSLSSCGTDVSWAAKIGDDTTVPIGMYIYAQAADYRSLVQNGTLSSSQKLSEQTLTVSDSDKSATEQIDKDGVKTVKSHVGALIKAKELNVELTDEEISSAESEAETTYETDKEVYEKNGIAKTSVVEYIKSTALKSKLFTAIYGDDGTNPVSDNELKKYIDENFATICYIQQYYYNEDGSSMTDEQKAKTKKQYETIKSQAEKGKVKFTDKCKEFEDNATSYKSGSTKYTTMWDASSEDGKKILDLKPGELTFLETDSAIVLVQKLKIDYDGAGLKTSRDGLLLQYKYTEFIDELIATAEKDKRVTFNQAAFDKFGSATRDFSSLSIPTSNYYGY